MKDEALETWVGNLSQEDLMFCEGLFQDKLFICYFCLLAQAAFKICKNMFSDNINKFYLKLVDYQYNGNQK